MATNKRTYPNDYFAWYNDDKRLAVVAVDTEVSSGERTKERYDSWQGTGNLSGNITATSTSAGAFVDMTSASHGLTVGDRVTISGTTTYDRNHAVTVVGDANTFRIAATNSTSNEGASSGVTWTSLFIDNGLRITYHAKYETITTSNFTDEFGSTFGVDTGMEQYIVCYMKARLLEDQGNIQQAQYFRQLYEKMLKQYPTRKSGVRQLSVPYM